MYKHNNAAQLKQYHKMCVTSFTYQKGKNVIPQSRGETI